MWTCTSPAPPGPPPTAKSTSPSSSASPTATAPTSANANRQPHPLRSPRNRCHRTRSPNTKPQIHTLIEARLIQMELFTAEVCEVQQDGVRYVLRRHPIRAAQRAASRADKQTSVEQLRQDLNGYLDKHPRAQPATAERAVRAQIAQLKIHAWLQVETEARVLKLSVNQSALEEAARLDGCYVIQTDLPESAASKQAVHDRYQDLAQVEQAFRNCKTMHLETRPIHVRTEEHTRGHVLVVMLAYLIRRELGRAWTSLDVTVEEGLRQLHALCSTEVQVDGGGSCLRIPTPHADTGGSAPSPGSPPTGSAASHRDECSHAQEAAHATKTPLEYYALAGNLA